MRIHKGLGLGADWTPDEPPCSGLGLGQDWTPDEPLGEPDRPLNALEHAGAKYAQAVEDGLKEDDDG